MTTCSIIGCRTKIRQKQPDLSLHVLPYNEQRRKAWLNIIGAENVNMTKKRISICSIHFEEWCFNRTLDRIRLKDDAVPSKILLPSARPAGGERRRNTTTVNTKTIKRKGDFSTEVQPPAKASKGVIMVPTAAIARVAQLENDMVNYMYYKTMGSIKQIRMKPKAVPSRFKFRRSDHPHKNIEQNEIVENTYCIATSLYIRPGAKLMTGTEDYENATNTKHIQKQCNIFSCICGETFSCVTSLDEHRKMYKHYRVSSGKKDVIKAIPAEKLKENGIDREKAIHPSKNIIYSCHINKKTQDNSRRENKYLTEAVPVRNKKKKDEIAASEFILPDGFIKQEIIEEISNNKAEDDEIGASQKEKDKIAASEFIIPDVYIKQEIIDEICNKKAEDANAASQLTIPSVFIEQEKEKSSIKEEKDDEKVSSELAIPSVFINQEIIEECLIKKEKDDDILTSELIIPPEIIKQEIEDEYIEEGFGIGQEHTEEYTDYR